MEITKNQHDNQGSTSNGMIVISLSQKAVVRWEEITGTRGAKMAKIKDHSRGSYKRILKIWLTQEPIMAAMKVATITLVGSLSKR